MSATAERPDTIKTVVAVYTNPVRAEALEALNAILTPELFHVAVNRVEMSPDEMRSMLCDIYEIARIAASKMEGR